MTLQLENEIAADTAGITGVTTVLPEVVSPAQPDVSAAPKTPAVDLGVWFNPDALSEARVGRTAAIGAAIGVIVCIVGLGLVLVALGRTPGEALAIAAGDSIWGGLGFGSMIGAVAGYNRAERDRTRN